MDEQQQQQQPLDYSSGEKASIIEMQLDVNTLIENKKVDLLGLVWDKEKQSYVRSQFRKPSINDEGADILLNSLRTYLEHPVTLGIITENEAREFAIDYGEILTQQIFENSREWEIKKTSDLDSFIASTTNLVFFNFTRAIKGATHRGIIDMAQLREVHSQAVHEREIPQQKKSWTENLKNSFS